MKSLDAKLAALKADLSARVFILADAKDADMAFGVRAPGPRGYLSAQGAQPAKCRTSARADSGSSAPAA